MGSALGLAAMVFFGVDALTEPARPAFDDDSNVDPVKRYYLTKMQAQTGDPEKLMALANFYLLGIGTEKDENEAARLHKLGAEKGDAFCQSCIGRDLLLGVGVKKDVAAALTWLRRSADQQQPDAEYALHQMYAEGTDVEANPAEARSWLLRAAEHGHHDARADLAEEILQEKDHKRAKAVLAWVEAGAKKGHARSCSIMGFIHCVGFGVKADPVEAMAWRLLLLNIDDVSDRRSWKIDYAGLGGEDQAKAEQRAKELSGPRKYRSPFARQPEELAAEKKYFETTKPKAEQGDAAAQYHLALLYEFGRGTPKDEPEAARWCRRAAEQGLAAAQFSLAQTLRLGEAIQPDMKEAFAWSMKAALQGNVEAEHALSVCYQEGDGVKADVNEAQRWRRLAAEHGEPRSQCNLGNDYFEKEPNAAKDAIAIRWYRKAAEQLHPKGSYSLGLCYLTGRGVSQDKIEGLAWMFTTADDLAPDLKDSVINIANDFTEDEIMKANERGKKLYDACFAKEKAREIK